MLRYDHHSQSSQSAVPAQAAATAEAAAATAAATASAWGLGSAIAGASTAGFTMLGGEARKIYGSPFFELVDLLGVNVDLKIIENPNVDLDSI